MNEASNNTAGMNASDTEIIAQKRREEYIFHCKYDPLPNANAVISSMTTLDVVFYVILILMTTVIIALFIDEVFYLKAHIKLSYRRRLSILQAGIPPVFAVTSLMGTFFPAGFNMIDFVCSVYFGFGLHAFLVLMVNYYGGLRQLLKRFEGRYVNINTGPFCCCLFCLPSFKMTKKTFSVLWYATFQAALLRPIVLFFQGVFQTDRSLKIPGMLYTGLLVTSMLSGMWALVIFRKASGDFLGRYRVTAKFFNFQMVLLIANLQPFIVTVSYNACSLPLTAYAKKIILNYQITIVEYFFLSLITRFLYRRSSDNEQLERVDTMETTLEENGNSEKATLRAMEDESSSEADNRVDSIV
ncbi:organic solute transporter subunit alpha-like [Clavelina lepadiformis]|uniref:organic solute transporter subunit alpha-like n=1 Tax=Clavelina lepadiformis TaxID=159417 RepID=UPI00404381BB